MIIERIYQILDQKLVIHDKLPSIFRTSIHKIFRDIENGDIDKAEKLLINLAIRILLKVQIKNISCKLAFQCFDTLHCYFKIFITKNQFDQEVLEILRLGSLLVDSNNIEDIYTQDILRRINVQIHEWHRRNKTNKI